MILPTYTIASTEFGYEPRAALTSLDWYNIAHCARQRMQLAHHYYKQEDPEVGLNLWKRERETFWRMNRKSIPDAFV